MYRYCWMIAVALATLECAGDSPNAPPSGVAPSASAAESSSWTVMDATSKFPVDDEIRAAYGHSPRALLSLLGFPVEDVNRLAPGTVTMVQRLNANFDGDAETEWAVVVEVLAKSTSVAGAVNASELIAFLDGPPVGEKKVVRRDEVRLADICSVGFEASVQNVHSIELTDVVGHWTVKPPPCRRRENLITASTGVAVWSLHTPLTRIAHTEEAWFIDRWGPQTRLEISIVGPVPRDIRVMRGTELLRTLKFAVAAGKYE